MGARWPQEKEKTLRKLLKTGLYDNFQIAAKMGISKNSIATKICHLGLKNQTYRLRITKHKHLRYKVMKYFTTHSFEETRKRFNLTVSELKSCFTVAYRDSQYSHLRKDKRNHESWSFDEIIFLMQHSGLRNRLWIAQKLKRGTTMYSAKEQLSRMGLKNRTIGLNGISNKLVNELLGEQICGVKTKAGPKSSTTDFQYKIVPWVSLYGIAKRKKINENILMSIKAMASLQKKIFNVKSNKAVISKIQKIIRLK